MDPHAENYLSISPYAYVGNNPMMFIDPDGRDINFYIWELKNDTEWVRQRVQFSQLDENLQKALESFAKTDEGFSFLSQFAKVGDMVGSVEFTEDGSYSKHDMSFDQFRTDHASWGTAGDVYTGDNLEFYMKINTARYGDNNTPESYAITTGHEAFLHLDQYMHSLISAYDNNDGRAYGEIQNRRRQIANDRAGGAEHDGYLRGDERFQKMNSYVNQLRKVLNPAEVNKHIRKHDDTIKRQQRR